MLWALVSLSLTAAPLPAIAVTRFHLVQVEPELGGYAEDRLAHALSEGGFKVTTPADLQTILGLERQKQLLGCSEDSACLAEISSALGVPLVASGRLTRLGQRFEVDVRVISQKDARVVASVTRSTTDEAHLGELLEQAGRSLAEQLLPPRPFRWRLWVPFAAGAASLIAGGVLIGTAELEYAAWTTPGSSAGLLQAGAITARYQDLALRRSLGIGLAGLGAALMTLGLVWNAVAPEAPVAVSLGASPEGAWVQVRGTF
jgi:hypothetical protein